MAERSSIAIPTPTPEQRRVAVENFNRARQVLLTDNYDYGISLLTLCCKLDPANVLYRQALRRAQKDKYGNRLKGSPLAFLTTPKHKARVKRARAGRDYLKVLEHGEEVLTRNPWDAGTQMDMADAFDALGLIDLAIFSLDQARQKYPKDATINRALARLFEKRGDFQKAIALWHLIRQANPQDVEAAHKAKDLAASATIARGHYNEVASGSEESPALSSRKAPKKNPEEKVADETESILKRLEADPTEPSLYIQLANVYRRHNQHDRAKATLQQGLGPTGQHISLQLALHEVELAPFQRNLDLAEKKLAELHRKVDANEDLDTDGPTLDELERSRAKLHKEVQTREIDLARLRADRHPSDLNYRLELGRRLVEAGLIEEAISELQQARRDDKLKPQAAMLLGQSFTVLNNWRLAQRNFEEALSTTSENDEAARKEILFQLAKGCAENGDVPRALDLGHELANLDYGYKNIGKLLDQWHETQQQA